MIKINLVPVKEKKKRQEFFYIFGAGVLLVLFVLTLIWVYVQKVHARNELTVKIQQIDDESKGYQDKINEWKDLQNKQASLDAFKKTIKGISEIQRKVIVAIDQLGLSLPSDIWFTNITQGRAADASKFTIQGYSFSQANLNQYFESLQKQGGPFKDATLNVTSIVAPIGKNKQINQFEITFKVADQAS